MIVCIKFVLTNDLTLVELMPFHCQINLGGQYQCTRKMSDVRLLIISCSLRMLFNNDCISYCASMCVVCMPTHNNYLILCICTHIMYVLTSFTSSSRPCKVWSSLRDVLSNSLRAYNPEEDTSFKELVRQYYRHAFTYLQLL